MAAKSNHLINEEIRFPEVRAIAADGTQLGVLSIEEARKIASDENVDLVLIAPQAKPPVVKIMDYGKFLFEQNKHEKETKKKQKIVNVKEIKLSPTIEKHDIEYKLKNARKFIQNGDRVKVSVKFSGRQMNYTKFGEQVLLDFAEMMLDIANLEKKPKLEGRNMAVFLSPKTEADLRAAAKAEKEKNQ